MERMHRAANDGSREAATEPAGKLLTAKEAAIYLRISLFTLRKIEQQGLVVPYRTPGGHRRYSIEMLNEYLEQSRLAPAAD
ncbi:MAG TPA: helix-turn-helix domain-containing protein [Anaerolineae bacterium]|nr:helix-turn-helix domain-containing protein [Anaerolineae bacterium]